MSGKARGDGGLRTEAAQVGSRVGHCQGKDAVDALRTLPHKRKPDSEIRISAIGKRVPSALEDSYGAQTAISASRFFRNERNGAQASIDTKFPATFDSHW